MGSRATKFDPFPAFVTLVDGSAFSCSSCKSKEFRRAESTGNLFCKCGSVYAATDISLLNGLIEAKRLMDG